MATVCEHLRVDELENRYLGCQDVTASRHLQVIWLLARGHTISQVSETTAFGERWIEQLLARYNAEGPEALGDLRRRNGAPPTILKPELLAKLRRKLDGWRTRPRLGRSAAWLGSVEGHRLVDPEAPPKESEISDAGRSGRI